MMSHTDEVVALYRYDENVSDQLYRRMIEDAQARDKFDAVVSDIRVNDLHSVKV